MIPDPSTAAAAVGLVQHAVSAINAIRGMRGSDVISAMFDPRGERTHGSDRIDVERHDSDPPDAVWWFSVEPVEGYTFMRFPLIDSGLYEALGHVGDAPNADAAYWRWAKPPPPGRITVENRRPMLPMRPGRLEFLN